MIAFLSGKVQRRLPDGVVLNVSGVGYLLQLPLSLVVTLPQVGEELNLWVYTKVREDALQLFGFSSYSERQVFSLLLDVNGVGPKVALAILSAISGEQLRDIVEHNQPELLHTVPGVGKRLADKIVLELQARLAKFPAPEGHMGATRARQPTLHDIAAARTNNRTSWSIALQEDLQSALENLGYRDKDIAPIVTKVRAEYRGEDLPQLLKQSLLLLSIF